MLGGWQDALLCETAMAAKVMCLSEYSVGGEPLCTFAGLMGGHSGLNIAEDRGNAVQFVARLANAVLKAAPNARLARLAGGDKRNAIAREASADLVVRMQPTVLRQSQVLHYDVEHHWSTLHMHSRLRQIPTAIL